MMEGELQGRPDALGAELKRRRLEQGVELEAIITETKVSRRVFEALEKGDYSKLPERVFCRNFLRQYAELIGDDPDAVAEAFDQAWERFELESGSFATLTVDEPPKRISRWWVWLPFVLAVVVVVLLTVLSFTGSRSTEPLPPDPRRSDVPRQAPQRTRAPATPFAVDSPVPRPSGDLQGSVAQVTATVHVEAGKECWVHYRDRDGATGQDLVGGGQSRTFRLPGPILLTVGNADAAVIEVGGRTYADLGRAGEVARFEISRDVVRTIGGSNGG